MGEHEKMLEILENLNIDKISGTLLQSKIIYYNNLSCAYQKTGRKNDAMIITKKVISLYNDAPAKLQEQYKGIIISARIFELESEEKYEEALNLSSERPQNDLLQKISAAMERAELHIALKNYEKAKSELRYVYMNGNKTYYVQKAKDMYSEIDSY